MDNAWQEPREVMAFGYRPGAVMDLVTGFGYGPGEVPGIDLLMDGDSKQSRIRLSDSHGITWLWIGYGLQISDLELYKTRLLTTRHVLGGKCYPAFCHDHGTAEST